MDRLLCVQDGLVWVSREERHAIDGGCAMFVHIIGRCLGSRHMARSIMVKSYWYMSSCVTKMLQAVRATNMAMANNSSQGMSPIKKKVGAKCKLDKSS